MLELMGPLIYSLAVSGQVGWVSWFAYRRYAVSVSLRLHAVRAILKTG